MMLSFKWTRSPMLILGTALLSGWDTPPKQGILRAEMPIRGTPAKSAHRSPVDIVLSTDGNWLVTANPTSHSLSLVDTASGTVVDELACGSHPVAIALCLDNQHVIASCSHSGEVILLQVAGGKLTQRTSISVGYEPVGIAVSPDGQLAYVGQVATGEVAVLDLAKGRVTDNIAVGAWPRYLALSPDGMRLAVGCSGESKIVVVDTQRREVLYQQRLTGGINIGHMQCSQDGNYAYFPWMVYRSNPITIDNIQRGWVLASRIGRVRLDGPAYRQAISLDVPRKAVADPHGLVISRDQRRLVVSASGTHELLVYRQPDLPFIGVGGPGDLIDQRLLADKDLFYRIDVGGRPMGLAIKADGRTVYVANSLKDCVQEVDIESQQVIREIRLTETAQGSLARRGMAIFYDARRSLDQWYSCHSCHYNGGVNSKAMDTLNDGSDLTMKTVLPLHHLRHTSPWTWHGWQTDLHDAMHKSFTSTMQGQPTTQEETRALLAFLETLQRPPNPFRNPDGSLTAAAQRGKIIFTSKQAGCANCHSGRHFTDGKIHDVGLGSEDDSYEGFNTPSLLGVYRKVRFLHDGRAKSLAAVLSGAHAPQQVTGERPLSKQERADLIEYLKSLTCDPP